jgi:hypothetical protein
VSDNVDAIFQRANLAFVGEPLTDVLKAECLLTAASIGISVDTIEQADDVIDAYARDLKRHVRLNWEHINEARTRSHILPGKA